MFLDAVRGFAIVAVIFVHSSNQVILKFTSGLTEQMTYFFGWGRFGVELFFLLSGFLMGSLYYKKGVAPSRFLASRFARLWPLWAAMSLLWFILGGHALSSESSLNSREDLLSHLIRSLTFTNWTNAETHHLFMPGSWSIIIEVYLYAIFALLLSASLKRTISVFVGINLLTIFSAGAVGVFSGFTGSMLASLSDLSLSSGSNFFLTGILLSQAFKPSSKRPFFLYDVTCTARLRDATGWLAVWLGTWVASPAVFGSQLEALGFVVISVSLLLFLPRRVLEAFAGLGSVSYGMFFLHFVVLHGIRIFVPIEILSTSNFLTYTLAIAAVFLAILIISAVAAWVSLKFFEGPARKFLLRRMSGVSA